MKVGVYMTKEKGLNLIKTLCLFAVYLFYTPIISQILNVFGLTDENIIMFVADLLFLISIVILYKKSLRDNWYSFRKDYSWKKKIGVITKWIAIFFICNMAMGLLTELLFPSAANEVVENTSVLSGLKLGYTVFKTIIFATIAEELLFKKSIRDVIENKWLFILVSGIVYTAMNFMYSDFSNPYIFVDVLVYLIPAFIFSYAYVKNNDNIIVPMIIKFFCNLFPLAILLASSLGA